MVACQQLGASCNSWLTANSLRSPTIQGACGHATDRCNRPQAHKGTIGNPPRGPGGPLEFSGSGEIPVKRLPGRVWGEIGTPKGFLGTMEAIPLAKNPGKPRGGPIPPQSYFFGVPFGAQKGALGLLGPRCRVGAQKMWSVVKNIKVAH